MDRIQIEKIIKKVVIEKGGFTVSPDALLLNTFLNKDEYALDSVQALEVLVALEKEFDIRFNDSDINDKLFTNIESLVNFSEKYLQEKEKSGKTQTDAPNV